MSTSGASPGAVDDRMWESAWLLTLGVSPRDRIRVYVADDAGEIGNDHLRDVRLRMSERPGLPWAMYLTDEQHRYRMIAFDLDAKGGRDTAAVAADADKIVGWCTELGISTLVCASGPAGGRHVWLGLAEPVDAATVRALALDVRRLCPTLDLSPLSNPATGCVRPPFAPHRHGGHSTPIAGHLRTLLNPTTTATALQALHRLVLQLGAEHTLDSPRVSRHAPEGVRVDENGISYRAGRRRELNPAGAQLLTAPLNPEGDVSAVLWRVLLGAAAARWRYSDLEAAMRRGAPGLEYARTARLRPGRPQRRPRPASGLSRPSQVLRRLWERAVATVASMAPSVPHDPTWAPRTAAVAAIVEQAQSGADAAPGRWTRGGGPSDRRVLDAMCLVSLQGVVDVVDIDDRRLAVLTGIHHATVARARHRLAQDGWIELIQPGQGQQASTWRITSAPDIHTRTENGATQACGSPPDGATQRAHWLTRLSERCAQAAHDAFTPRAAGLHTGNLYARHLEDPARPLTMEIEGRLSTHGLLPQPWESARNDLRVEVAARYGTTGTLARRAERHHLDRLAWAWWQAELDWMSRRQRAARPGLDQPALLPGPQTWPPHPRRRDGRADYARARRQLAHRVSATPAAA